MPKHRRLRIVILLILQKEFKTIKNHRKLIPPLHALTSH